MSFLWFHAELFVITPSFNHTMDYGLNRIKNPHLFRLISHFIVYYTALYASSTSSIEESQSEDSLLLFFDVLSPEQIVKCSCYPLHFL